MPLNITALKSLGEGTSRVIYDEDKFAILVNVKNDNARHSYTKVKLDYSQNNINYLYLYAADGKPLVYLGNGTYEFDKDVLPLVETQIYVAGMVKEIPVDYPYVAIDFKLTYVDDNGIPLASDIHQLEVHKSNYALSTNISN
jgi:hypothetical protein